MSTDPGTPRPTWNDSKRTDAADAHLSYFASGVRKYDVYRAEEGSERLGVVYRNVAGGWTAECFRNGRFHSASADARWVAACALWPEERFA
jgi:hypothetical protein